MCSNPYCLYREPSGGSRKKKINNKKKIQKHVEAMLLLPFGSGTNILFSEW